MVWVLETREGEMDKINAKVSKLSLEMLKEMAAKLFSDTRDGSEIVFSAVISALETKMPEAEFVSFCDAL